VSERCVGGVWRCAGKWRVEEEIGSGQGRRWFLQGAASPEAVNGTDLLVSSTEIESAIKPVNSRDCFVQHIKS